MRILSTLVILIGLVTSSTANILQSASNHELLLQAKTLYIETGSNESGGMALKAEIARKLIKWGKLTLTEKPEQADLILRIEQTRNYNLWKGTGAQGVAILTDKKSGIQLLSATSGGDYAISGASIGKVGRSIADRIIRFYDKGKL